MARSKETRAHDAELTTSEEVYQLARQRVDMEMAALREEIQALRDESFGMGALHAIEANISYNEFLKAMTLYRIKQEKEYRKGGMTWAGFCEARGLECRRVDEMLADIRSIADSFSAEFAGFCGLPFNKIRQLGRHVSAESAEIVNGTLIYGDESIPLTPEYRDDLQALIERIGEEAEAAKDDAEARLSAKDKVLKSKEDVINKQERALKKYEKEAAVMGITPEEDAYIQQINNLKTGFDGYLLRLEKNIVPEDYDTFTPRMKATLISAAHYMQMQILALYDTVTTEHGNSVMNPELTADFETWNAENN